LSPTRTGTAFWSSPAVRVVLPIVLLFALWIGRVLLLPDTSLLPPGTGNAWIAPPAPLSTYTFREGQQAVFRKTLPSVQGSAEVRVAALREFRLFVNGALVHASGAEGNWKVPTSLDLGAFLQAARNEVVIQVHNPDGPPLLYVSSGAPVAALDTRGAERAEAPWRVSRDGRTFVDAVQANDRRPIAEAFVLPSTLDALWMKRGPLALLFGIGAVMFLLGSARRFRDVDGVASRIPVIALGAVTVLWTLLFVTRHAHIPPQYGFDAQCHLDYIRYLWENRALPLLDEGCETAQPPLFYVIEALLGQLGFSLAGPTGTVMVVKAFPMLCGLGIAWSTFFLAGVVFPGEPTRRTFAVLIAGLCPMSLYMSAYVSNESLHALLLTVFLTLVAHLLAVRQARTAPLLLAGGVWGAAMLTKMTSAVFLPVAMAFIGAKLIHVERLSWRATAGRLVGMLAVGILVCGWFYGRNIALYGKPFVATFDFLFYWQQPGFRSIGYYLQFGAGLTHPFFVGFQSFWDAVYATFWGDFLIGGQGGMSARHGGWDDTYMSAVVPLALPASALMLWGGLCATVASLRKLADPASILRLFLLAALLLMVGLILHFTIVFPYYSTPKAFYGWGLLGVVAVLGADGFARLHSRLAARTGWGRLPGALFYGWAGSLAGTILLAYGP
jgi:hypothetical protein